MAKIRNILFSTPKEIPLEFLYEVVDRYKPFVTDAPNPFFNDS